MTNQLEPPVFNSQFMRPVTREGATLCSGTRTQFSLSPPIWTKRDRAVPAHIGTGISVYSSELFPCSFAEGYLYFVPRLNCPSITKHQCSILRTQRCMKTGLHPNVPPLMP
jgi:hypothetical protein